jgi:hypothetical protein
MWRAGLAGALVVVSFVSSYQGALNPWQPDLPLFHIEYSVPDPRQYLAVGVSGYTRFSDVTPNLQATFGYDHMVRRWFDARHGFAVPHGPVWWFVHESTPIAPEFAGPLGLDLDGSFSLYADLTPAALQWLDTFETDAHTSPTLVPPSDQSLEAMPLPVTFDAQASLMGYRRQQSETELTLITAWRIETRQSPTGPRKAFVHLLAPDGSIAAQSDLLAATYDTLYPTDLFFQVQRLSLSQLAPGKYWLHLGLYNPDSMTRLTIPGGHDRLLLFSVERSAQ